MEVIDFAASISPSGIFTPETPHIPAGATIQWPMEIMFGGPLDHGLRVIVPLPVQISKENGTYIANCAAIQQFGYGSDMSEALDDFGKTVAEMFLYLSEESKADRLGNELAIQYKALQQYLERRDSTVGPA
jgi:hypothetical protein